MVVGVRSGGHEVFTCHGVTDLDDPRPVGPHTLHQWASVTKTYTATAPMCLVGQGLVDVDAPVRRYVPELVLADEDSAARITVLNLLNHTAGLDWNLLADTGEGDDALASFVARMAEVDLIAAPGTRASYGQAGYKLAGRILEHVTGQTYERAFTTPLFEPLGMTESFFAPAPDPAIATHAAATHAAVAVGHNLDEGGRLTPTGGWTPSRANNPGGGLVSSVADQLRWARFHLGDGRAESGARLLPTELLHRMRERTTVLRASSLGHGIGFSWFLREVDGVATIGHGGSANGQFAELLLVPEHDFAVVAVSNAGPEGTLCNQAVVRRLPETHLGLYERAPEPIPFDPTRAAEITGDYDIDAMTSRSP
ncbi:serine hydrolase domain-containing protein [Streptomyces sp. NPDC088097]|uniref:serine hydrolase domain-containing protein n=1 Tax=Streptomyces sp. NPDC088097 TaxID=3365823 RepID=UPI0038029172